MRKAAWFLTFPEELDIIHPERAADTDGFLSHALPGTRNVYFRTIRERKELHEFDF